MTTSFIGMSSEEPASELSAARLPRATRADPEGEQDESHIQSERLPADVDPVVTKLVAPQDVAGRVDLSQAGQAWPDRRSLGKPRHGLEPDAAHRSTSYF